MRIGVLGSGHIGATLAKLWAKVGHEVMISGRDLAKARHSATDAGPGVSAGTFAEAARFGEAVVLAIHWQHAVLEGALPDAALFAGKIVIDAMNPYRLDGIGLHELNGAPSSRRVAQMLPGARLVKAFNTIHWIHLRDEGRLDLPDAQRWAIFVASDDAEAKKQVVALIKSIGFAAIDTGDFQDSRVQEPGTAIYNRQLTGAEAIRLLAETRGASAH